MIPYLADNFGNAASRNHAFGWVAEKPSKKREQVAALIGTAKEIVFTSGATESDNMALGALEFYAKKGKHIITSPVEHKRSSMARWLERQGGEATRLPVGENELIDPAEVEKAIRPDTVVVSLMHGNNEIGVLNPLAEIGAICKKHGVLFTDAAKLRARYPSTWTRWASTC